MRTAPRTAHRTASLLLGLALATTTAACTPGEPDGPPRSAPSMPPDSLCVLLLAHWGQRALAAESGTADLDPGALDYQSMGLSGDQYEILRAALAEARTRLPEPGGREAADRVMTARINEGCRLRYSPREPSVGPAPVPTGGPW
ncbi:hypothetical protein ACN20G_20815 [Streptomyces sp. BI20]|uniref:hypothetical protein n=1 Tax=Streptomyces sp. BI20 TaxID=3403460 RepID=UPI003C728B24